MPFRVSLRCFSIYANISINQRSILIWNIFWNLDVVGSLLQISNHLSFCCLSSKLSYMFQQNNSHLTRMSNKANLWLVSIDQNPSTCPQKTDFLVNFHGFSDISMQLCWSQEKFVLTNTPGYHTSSKRLLK